MPRKVNWNKEMGIDKSEIERESPFHPRQKQIMRFHEERAARYEEYRRLIALGRLAAAEALYWSDYEKKTREMAEYMDKPMPPAILESNRERGTYE
jgi:hypothetical protein